MEALPDGKGVVLGLEVFPLIVDVEFVRGCRVAAAVFAQRDVLLFFAFRRIVHHFFKHRILFQLLLDTLFQFGRRQFDQLDGLDLQGRELLELLLQLLYHSLLVLNRNRL